ncbi:MAG: peptide ABC transporter substrate-binding protein [Gammaproteobacteria bacterium]
MNLRPVCRVLAVALAAAGLAACSQSAKPQAKVHKISVKQAPAPVSEQVLQRQSYSSPRTLDPSLAEGSPAQKIIEDLFEGLTTISEGGRVVPGVASSWTVSDGGKRYVFHLRANARWSNGKPVTAQDFIYAWQREVNPKTGAEYAQALKPIVNAEAIMTAKLPPSKLGVEAPNPHTLIVHLNSPTPYFLYELTDNYLYPLYPPAVRKWGDTWTRPEHIVSDGAFNLAAWVVNGHLTLDKNPYYWNAAKVRLRKVVYHTITKPGSALSEYLAGDLEWTASPGAFPSSERQWVKKHLGDQLSIASYFGNAYLGYMVTRKPFNNRDLRLAMSMAVDRRILAKDVSHGFAEPAYSLVPPLRNYKQSVPAWAHWPRAKRIAKAQQLYKAAGYSRQHPLHVRVLYPSAGPSIRHFMEALQTMWRQNIGADVTLYNEQWKVYLQDTQYGHSNLFWSAWIGDYPDPYTFAQLFDKGFAMNYGHFDDSAYNALISAADHETDNQKRYRLFEKAGRIINREMPYIPLYYYVAYRLIKPYVAGWKNNIMDRHLSQYMYILKHKVH